MAGSTSQNGFNARSGADSIREAVDQVTAFFDRRDGGRGDTAGEPGGDVRGAVLTLLNERPMHGYEVMHEIEQRSDGRWRPSAGSVYPMLQQLVDEGLVSAEEVDGRKRYVLLDAGREYAVAADGSSPFDATSSSTSDERSTARLPRSAFELAQAAVTVRRSGTSAQAEQAAAVLDDARRKLYSILAQA